MRGICERSEYENTYTESVNGYSLVQYTKISHLHIVVIPDGCWLAILDNVTEGYQHCDKKTLHSRSWLVIQDI